MGLHPKTLFKIVHMSQPRAVVLPPQGPRESSFSRTPLAIDEKEVLHLLSNIG